MGQQYIQKFEYRSASKSEFDQAWTVALQTFAKTGNWGGVEAGVPADSVTRPWHLGAALGDSS